MARRARLLLHPLFAAVVRRSVRWSRAEPEVFEPRDERLCLGSR
jgi:hypothetical protein